MPAKFDFGKPIDEVAEEICGMVMELKTVRQIADHFGCGIATVLRISAMPEYADQYARARDYAADLLEADIYTAAEAATPETAAADRVKIDALKWIAARRAPKRYGDKVQQEVTATVSQSTTLSIDKTTLDDIIAKL